MEAEGMIDRVDTCAIARCGAFEVFVRYGLDGGDAAHAFLETFTDGDQLLERVRFDVELLLKHVELLRGLDHQIGVGEAGEVGVAVGAAEARFADRFRDGAGLEDGTIEVLVALLDVVQNLQRIVELQAEHLILGLQQLVLLLQEGFHGGGENVGEKKEERYPDQYADAGMPDDSENALLDGGIDPLEAERLRVVLVVYLL